MNGNQLSTNGGTFLEVLGPKLQQKKLWDQIETFAKFMGPKLQQKSYETKLRPLPKLWDQNCNKKVMRPN